MIGTSKLLCFFAHLCETEPCSRFACVLADANRSPLGSSSGDRRGRVAEIASDDERLFVTTHHELLYSGISNAMPPAPDKSNDSDITHISA
jgi:hypothetical protein